MLPPGKRAPAHFFLIFLALLVPVAAQDKPSVPPPLRLDAGDLKPDATVDAGGERHFLAAADAMWIASTAAGTLARIDPKTNTVTHTVTLGGSPCGPMTFAFGSIWVPLCGKGVARVDPKTHTLTATVATQTPASRGAVVSAVGSIWTIADERGTLTRLDPDANTAVAEVYTEPGGVALAFGADALWIASPTANLVTRLNPYTNVVTQTIKVAGQPSSLVVADGAVWTLNSAANSVSRIDIKTNKVAETIALGAGGSGGQITSGAGSIWITRTGLPLARVDPRTNRLVQIFSGTGGGSMGFGHDALWLAATATHVWRLDPKRVEAIRRISQR